jgi:hypothetical protein
MWSLTLTGIFYPYLRDKFDLDPGAVLLPMLLLFVLILSMVVFIGLVFDKMRFWKEQNIVVAERNPYCTYKLTARDLYWMRIWVLAVKANPNLPPEIQKEVDFYEKWMEFNLREDKTLRADVERLGTMFRDAPGGDDAPSKAA